MVSGPGVQAGVTEFLAQSEDQVAHLDGQRLGEAASGRRERGSKAASPSTRYPAVSRDPGLGQAVAACCFGLGQGPAW